MKFDTIKNLIQKDGGKCIIVENDEPVLVIMSFEEYQQKVETGEYNAVRSQSFLQEEATKQEDLLMKEPGKGPFLQHESSSSGFPSSAKEDKDNGELTIDDLPL